ncbi:MAG: hypothetical protein HQL72_02310 [Magnetococcales bacterium]|nr:hypothetical protein [Magnetococcales bacterium]
MNHNQTQPEPLSWGEIRLNQVLWINFVPHATANSLNPILSIASDTLHPTIQDLEKIKGERFVYYPD